MSRIDAVPEVLWQPSPARVASARISGFAAFAAAKSGRDLPDYGSLWSYSTTDLEGFWSAVADYFDVRWHRAPERVLALSVMPGAEWFPGGTLNYAEHALAGSDTRPDSDPAVIVSCEDGTGEHITLADLRRRVGAAQAGLRPGRDFAITATIEQLRAALPGLSGAVHIPVLGTATPDGMTGWADFVAVSGAVEFTPVPFSAPLWVLYSSGTTGLPKPIVQSVGGILMEHMKSIGLQSDLGPGDRFFWFSTTGWMMWNYLVGGLLVGATILLYDGSPGYPDLMTLWRLAARHRISYFGTSAPFIMACRKAGLAPAELDLTSIKTIGSTGSPLYAEGFDWIHDHVGTDIQIASLSGGTDICTALVGAAPTVPVWKGEISCRALGARVEAFSRTGESLTDEVGELVVTAPMPSMPVFFWGDDGTRLHDSYFADYPGVWRHGDWIRITPRGSCVIEGRSDATLNRGGVRMGTAEFYRVVEMLPEVIDSLVVDTSTSSGPGDLLLFLVLADGAELTDVEPRLRSLIRSELSPRHVPGAMVPVSAVPRTLNGKKCEVPIKRILAGAVVSSVVSMDALADPTGFDAFLSAARAAVGPANPQ